VTSARSPDIANAQTWNKIAPMPVGSESATHARSGERSPAKRSPPRRDIVMISTADWDNPYWTNKQHVAQKLGEIGHRVFYVDSLGLRRPAASRRDFSRIWLRLKRSLRAPRRVHQNIWVWSPIVVPLHDYALVRQINRLLFGAGLGFWLAVLRFRQDLLWTYSPLSATLLNIRRFTEICYHSVDDVKTQPGVPAEIVERSELELLCQSDVVFVTAPHLLKTHSQHNANTHYFPNVADYNHFSRAMDPATAVPADLQVIPPPRIGFIGAISGYKLDFELIAKVARLRPLWSIVLIGEVGEGDPETTLEGLEGLPNLHILGGRSYASLPGYLRGMDVMLLPSRMNDYTRSMFPMKFFEYLAAGRPIVGVPLPSLVDFQEYLLLRDDAEGFSEAIELALSNGGPSLERRLKIAREHTYEIRTRKMLAIIDQHCQETFSEAQACRMTPLSPWSS
jgi:glycosyltransferase involved in cell wall biosynthesis